MAGFVKTEHQDIINMNFDKLQTSMANDPLIKDLFSKFSNLKHENTSIDESVAKELINQIENLKSRTSKKNDIDKLTAYEIAISKNLKWTTEEISNIKNIDVLLEIMEKDYYDFRRTGIIGSDDSIYKTFKDENGDLNYSAIESFLNKIEDFKKNSAEECKFPEKLTAYETAIRKHLPTPTWTVSQMLVVGTTLLTILGAAIYLCYHFFTSLKGIPPMPVVPKNIAGSLNPEPITPQDTQLQQSTVLGWLWSSSQKTNTSAINPEIRHTSLTREESDFYVNRLNL